MGVNIFKVIGMLLLVAGIGVIAIGIINLVSITAYSTSTPTEEFSEEKEMQDGAIQSFIGVGAAIIGYLMIIYTSGSNLTESLTRLPLKIFNRNGLLHK